MYVLKLLVTEAVVQKYSVKKVFSCEFFEISKNAFIYRTPLVAASVVTLIVSFIVLHVFWFNYGKTRVRLLIIAIA